MESRTYLRSSRGTHSAQKRNASTSFALPGVLFLLFALLTTLLLTVDVQAIGPQGSSVGLASLNTWFAQRFQEAPFWDTFTDGLSYVAYVTATAFALLGLFQLVTRKSLKRVDSSLIILGGIYILTAACFMLFEIFVVNSRPILVEGVLEASYPSTHTMAVVCIMGTALLQLRSRLQKPSVKTLSTVLVLVVIILTVLGRLVSGVHWFTAIMGGLLLGLALVALYSVALQRWAR